MNIYKLTLIIDDFDDNVCENTRREDESYWQNLSDLNAYVEKMAGIVGYTLKSALTEMLEVR